MVIRLSLPTDNMNGWEGEGNIDRDPLFVDPENRDFHLKVDSPCSDAGDPASTVPFNGGCRIDRGACEFDRGFNCREISFQDDSTGISGRKIHLLLDPQSKIYFDG